MMMVLIITSSNNTNWIVREMSLKPIYISEKLEKRHVMISEKTVYYNEE